VSEKETNLMKVRFAGLTHESVTDGPGIRSVLFFQGCPHACSGCHNPQTWSFTGGNEKDVDQVIQSMQITPLLSGFTFSGGEPFAQAPAAVEIAGYVKSRQLSLWIYTGYVWEQLLTAMNKPGYRDLLTLADVIVDGPYQKQFRSLNLPYRGSQNQRIIRVEDSLQSGKLVEWQMGTPD
jgi:anaerobic ribonucleoside-triphosphate reductase activating protein